MANINDLLRRTSGYINTGGEEPPRGISMVPMMSGGVYTSTVDVPNPEDIIQGRVSLGFIGVLIVVAVAFYIYTHDIQGGG